MNYRPIRNPRTKSRSDVAIPLVFLAVLIFFYIFYPTILASLASRIASPLWRAEGFFSDKMHGVYAFFSSKETLVRESEELRAELDRARAELQDRDLLEEEHATLLREFGRSEQRSEHVVGRVLSLPPKSLYDTAVLDVGTREGVTVGDKAAYGKVILGVVVKAYRTTSVVELYSTAGRKTSVSILHDGKAISVEAEGRGGGEFMVTLPKEVAIGVGDAVTMPGQALFLFARVENIEANDTDSFQFIRFKNPVSFSQLRFLDVLKQAPNTTP